jgi:hypothetical protein
MLAPSQVAVGPRRRVRRHLPITDFLGVAALVLTGSLLGYAVVDRADVALPLLGGMCFAAFVALASVKPVLSFQIATVALVTFPPYALRLPTEPPHPATALFAGIVVALCLRRPVLAAHGAALPRFRWNAVDVASAAFFLALLLNVAIGARTRHDIEPLLIGWLPIYIATRLVVSQGLMPIRLYYKTWIIAGVALAVIAYYETFTGQSLFRHIFHYYPASPWYVLPLNGSSRFGGHRVDASFGHPIAFAMFMSTVCIMALTLAIRATGKARVRWLVAAALLAAAEVPALSRAGWVLLVLGVILVITSLAFELRIRILPIILTGTTVATGVLFLIPQTSTLLTGLGLNDAYRSSLLSYALRYDSFHLLGNATSSFYGVVSPLGNPTPSIDNQYLLTLDRWGYVGFVGLVSIVVVLAILCWPRPRPVSILPVAAIALASLLTLLAVAFITQEQCVIWSLLGATAGARQLTLSTRSAWASQAGRDRRSELESVRSEAGIAPHGFRRVPS